MNRLKNYNEVMVNYLRESFESGKSYQGVISIKGGKATFRYDSLENDLTAEIEFDDGSYVTGVDISEGDILIALELNMLKEFYLEDIKTRTKNMKIVYKTFERYKFK